MRGLVTTVVIAVVVAASLVGPIAFSAPLDQLTQICSNEGGVLPGIGIGSVRLGNSFVDTVNRLGPPANMGANPNRDAGSSDPGWRTIVRSEDGLHGRARALFGVRDRFLWVQAIDNAIEAIQILAVDCRDNSGLGLGTSWATVVAQYGEQYSTWRAASGTAVVYNSWGLQVLVAPTASAAGSVVGFEVFAPGRYCEAFGRTACAKYSPPLR